MSLLSVPIKGRAQCHDASKAWHTVHVRKTIIITQTTNILRIHLLVLGSAFIGQRIDIYK